MRASAAGSAFSSFGILGPVFLGSCIASNVVAVEDRSVRLREDTVAWQPAKPGSVPGLYASSRIEGPIAASILKLYYLLEASGEFTGAALLSTSPPRFEVLNGEWSFAAGRLQLGPQSAPARLEEAEGMLRLTGAKGSVVLYREEIR